LKTISLSIFLLAAFPAHSQNLISNGGFEDENICTEYHKNCAPEAWIATSLTANYYFDDSVNAYRGRHFIGIAAGNLYRPGIRNFVRARLLCGLQKGHKYRLEFFIRSRNDILDSIGVYFSANDFLFEKMPFRYIEPQLWSADIPEQPGISFSDWHKLSFEYIANGEEGFITIGNFKREDHKREGRAEYKNDYYFFVDEVSLIPENAREQLCAAADSVQREIYAENERHELLSKKIYYYTKRPPAIQALPGTRMQADQRIDTLTIPDIFFKTASYELNPASHNLLDSFAGALNRSAIDSVVIEGHTDSIGKLQYNAELSASRANSVKEYLLSRSQTNNGLYRTRGFAYLKPVADNRTPAGRSRNRRVEIRVYRR
jgi:outer membrane protein OmpA-like peptidoglycan-associated protein